MLTPRDVILAAIDRLHELEEDPRDPLLRALERLATEPSAIPEDQLIELTAIIGIDGACRVTDQNGREVRGVTSVANFLDQNNRPVMQINF